MRAPAARPAGGATSDVGGLGDDDAGHDHETAEPARHTKPVAGEGEAEEGGPHRFEREGERGLRGGRATLRPRLREKRERAREDAGHEQRPPDRPAVRDGELTGEHGDDEQSRERGQHLDEREGERVVSRRVALHQHDLQRVDRGARKHEQIPERRAAVHAGEQREPDRRKQHAAPGGGADPRPEAHERKQRRQHDVHAGDEARRGDGRALEPCGLQRVARSEQRAGERCRADARAAERAHAPRARRRKRAARDREPQREEREEGIDRNRVLHLHEGHAPHRGDGDEQEQRLHAADFAICDSQRRRINAENGPTTRQ